MITVCDDSHKNEVLSYIGDDYPKCLYLYLDIVKYGCASETTRTWFQSSGRAITSVLLSYHTAVHVFSRNNAFDVVELSNLICEIKPTMVNASEETIKILEPILRNQGFVAEFGRIGEWKGQANENDNSVSLADIEDIPQVARLLYENEVIGSSYIYEDLLNQMRERLSSGFVRGYVIRDGKRVLAHVGTGAETEKVSTLAYAITAPDQRGKGLASRLFSHACSALRKEGKRVFSVYYPESAKRFHHKMGFEDVCKFGKLYLNVQNHQMKRILIVGGANGIGLSIALELAKRATSERVYVVDKEPLAEKYAHPKIKSFQFDLTESDYSFFNRFTDIDALMITAGFGRIELFKDLPEQHIIDSFNVNTIPVLRLIKKFYPKLEANEDFYCGVMGSISGFMSSPVAAIYGSTKAALKIFIESVNVELEKGGSNNKILNVSPGAIKGSAFYGKPNDLDALRDLSLDIIKHLEAKHDLFIPMYDEVFKSVLQRYHDDFRKEGRHSYEYKMSSDRYTKKK